MLQTNTAPIVTRWVDSTNRRLQRQAFWFDQLTKLQALRLPSVPETWMKNPGFWAFVAVAGGTGIVAASNSVQFWLVMALMVYIMLSGLSYYTAFVLKDKRNKLQAKMSFSSAMWPGDIAWAVLNLQLAAFARTLDWAVVSIRPAVHAAIKTYLDGTTGLRRQIQLAPSLDDKHPAMSALRKAAHRAAVAIDAANK